jgi:hypothetical protein
MKILRISDAKNLQKSHDIVNVCSLANCDSSNVFARNGVCDLL